MHRARRESARRSLPPFHRHRCARLAERDGWSMLDRAEEPGRDRVVVHARDEACEPVG